MNFEKKSEANPLLRACVVVGMIALAAVLRIVPHPWNFAPIGAMALFGGAMLRHKGAAFAVLFAALFAGDLVIGFHSLMPVVYASFALSVVIGFCLRGRRTAARIGGATLLGAIQFFVFTNLAVWALEDTYPRTGAGFVACYVAAVPYFWNTLAGDAFYAVLFFGGFALAEKYFPALHEPVQPAEAAIRP